MRTAPPSRRMPELSPHEERLEAMAKLLAAALMGLVKDPTGSKLPPDCWKQMLPKAEATLRSFNGL